MALQDYDPFSIKKYAFTYKKSNTYFTLPTILLSFSIITLSIIMNQDIISHLWIPRSDLPSTMYQSSQYPTTPLNSTLLCYQIWNFTSNGTYPSLLIKDVNFKLITNFVNVSQEQALKRFPQLAAKINATFSCVDLEGLIWTNMDSSYYIQANAPGKAVQYYLQTSSISNLTQGNNPQFIKIFAMYSLQQGSTGFLNKAHVKFTYMKVLDTLWLNQEPQQLTYFDSYVENILSPQNIYSSPNAKLHLAIVQKNQQLWTDGAISQTSNTFTTLTCYEIKRFDISYIIGSVLSWISMLSFIFGIFVIPIMEKSLLLAHTEAVFHVERHMLFPSLFRFIIASYRKGVYPKEDIYVKLGEQFQKRKNIQLAIKINRKFRQLPYEDTLIGKIENFSTKQNFEYHDNNEITQGYHKNDKGRCGTSSNDVWITQVKKEKEGIKKKYQQLMKKLDLGSQNISLLYFRNGHGSKVSFALSIIFGVGFLVFISMFGLFKYITISQKYNLITTDTFSYTLEYNQLVFSIRNDTNPLVIEIKDGNLKSISNLTLISNSSCLQYIPLKSYAYFTFLQSARPIQRRSAKIYCLPHNFTLVSSNDPAQSRLLFATNTFLNKQSDMKIMHVQKQSRVIQNAIEPISYIYGTANFYIMGKIKLTNYQHNGKLIDQKKSLQTLSKRTTSISQYASYGMTIELDPKQAVISTTTNSIFDIVQTVWGLASICFTVILFKITKYINKAYKRQRLTSYVVDFKESMSIFLSKMDGLLKGKHKSHVQKAPIYFKERQIGCKQQNLRNFFTLF